MNNFLRKLERRIATNPQLLSFYQTLEDKNSYMELENNIDTRLLVTALQANLGGLVGEHLGLDHVYTLLVMHTTLPSTPLCLIDRPDLLDQIVSKELLNQEDLINSIRLRSKAIEGVLKAGNKFIALYIKEYSDDVMANLRRLEGIYPNLILKKVDHLPENLHGATYIVNEKEKDGESLFLASVITTQCNQSLKDSLELTKIFIKNCNDDDFMSRLFVLNKLLLENGINLKEIVHIEKEIQHQ
jgi:hypothetical protein